MKLNIFRYILIYLISVGAVMVLGIVLEAVAGVSQPMGVSTVAPALIAAILEGQRLARLTSVPLCPALAWRMAWTATAIVAAISAVILAVMVSFLDLVPIPMASGMVWIAVAFCLGMLVLTLLITRFALTWVVKSELRAMEKGAG